MASTNPWPLIHAERAALAADLQQLSDDQWATASLCDGWSVRDVVAHMTATAKMTTPRFVGRFIGSGLRFGVMTDRDVAAERGNSPQDALSRFQQHEAATTHPPGPLDAMVGEVVVHSEDIRRPLQIRHAYADDALIRSADFFRRSNLLIGGKGRATGLTLRATDVDWTAGSGPEVSGPMTSIILAITGRRSAIEDLSGEGLAVLAARK